MKHRGGKGKENRCEVDKTDRLFTCARTSALFHYCGFNFTLATVYIMSGDRTGTLLAS